MKITINKLLGFTQPQSWLGLGQIGIAVVAAGVIPATANAGLSGTGTWNDVYTAGQWTYTNFALIYNSSQPDPTTLNFDWPIIGLGGTSTLLQESGTLIINANTASAAMIADQGLGTNTVTGGTQIWNVNGGAGNFWVGCVGGQTYGTLNVKGGTVVVNADNFVIGGQYGNGFVNITGGRLITSATSLRFNNNGTAGGNGGFITFGLGSGTCELTNLTTLEFFYPNSWWANNINFTDGTMGKLEIKGYTQSQFDDLVNRGLIRFNTWKVDPSTLFEYSTNAETGVGIYQLIVKNISTAPDGLAALAGPSQVKLTWNPVGYASGYNIYRSTTSGSGYTLVASDVPETQYVDATVANGQTYYYVVGGTNSLGAGANSTEISVLVGAALPPTGLVARSEANAVLLSWNGYEANTGYNIYRSTTSGGGYARVASNFPGTNYVDAGVTVGVVYYYVVAGTNASGQSAYSAEVSGLPFENTSGIWTNFASGTWSSPVNWTNRLSAHGFGNTANFATLRLKANTTVTLDSPVTIANLTFGDIGNAYSWSLEVTNGGSLTLDGTGPSIMRVNNQSASISAGMTGTNGLVKEGNGALFLTGQSFYSGDTIVNAGTLTLNASSVVGPSDGTITGTLTINPGATVNNYARGLGMCAASRSAVYVMNVIGGTFYSAPDLDYTAPGIQVNLTGGTLNFDTGAGLGAGYGTVLNTFPTNVPSVINGAINLGDNNPGDLFQINVAAGTASPDLLVNAVIQDGQFEVRPVAVHKNGDGTMLLKANNTFVGSTIVNGGTLALDSSASLAGAVEVQAGGNLASGATALSPIHLNNALTLAGNITLRVSKSGGTTSCDSVVNVTDLTYGGTLTLKNVTAGGAPLSVGDRFYLFPSANTRNGSFTTIIVPGSATYTWDTSRLATDGSISVASVSTVNTNPTPVSASVSGNVLTLSWPADHIGWRLLMQTNNLSKGISVNPADWSTVPGSDVTNKTEMPINLASPTEFYRLVYP